jgi:hypothetical protein
VGRLNWNPQPRLNRIARTDPIPRLRLVVSVNLRADQIDKTYDGIQKANRFVRIATTPRYARPVPFAEGPYGERNGKVSPDSKWIAYSSNETGRFEVYVQSFPAPGHKIQISAAGGDRAECGVATAKNCFSFPRMAS